MNLDNLQYYLSNERVYSNDLNVILSRTPSRIFTFILFTLLFAFLVLVGFSFFTRYSETVNTKAIATWRHNRPVLYFLSGGDSIGKIRVARQGVIGLRANGKLLNKAVSFDSISVQELYDAGGAEYASLADLQKSKKVFDSMRVKYAVTCYPSLPSSEWLGNDSEQLVQVTFLLTKRRLISKYIKIAGY
jgi:hypothetical protein